MEEQIIRVVMIPLRGLSILPNMSMHVDVSRPRSVAAAEALDADKTQKVFLVAQKEISVDDPQIEHLYEVGSIASMDQMMKVSNTTYRLMVSGHCAAKLREIVQLDPYMVAEVELLKRDNDVEVENLQEYPEGRLLQDLFFEYTVKSGKIPKSVVKRIADITEFSELVDEIAANIPLDYRNVQDLLEEPRLSERYKMLIFKMQNEIGVLDLKKELQLKVKEKIEKNQKDYILREQLKAIREELGEDNTISEAEEFERTTNALIASNEVKEKIKKEIHRFKGITQYSSENNVIRTYIETMLEMPWDKMGEDKIDLDAAKKILDEEHYGLDKVKERVLEFLAVRALTQKGESPILCLVGPPGTGKTSIARSLAHAMNKPYARISLGGVRDEAEIRGHRKTYVGAMPGRIANALRRTGVKNPLLLLDEIDKVSNDYKGDTFSALLEVLDGEQNVKFRDHYLEVPMDLSEVVFVTTANTLQTIPRPLLDRMEVIEISSYTENEKLHIAEEHLVPKQRKKHGLKEEQIAISKSALVKVIQGYTKEAGVRQLERKISGICRKAARDILEHGKTRIRITESNLEKYLGKPRYSQKLINDVDEVGIVRGLAWTSVGGDTLEIETTIMPGKGEILLTGQLGDVMKESARTGISYIRSIGKEYHLEDDYFETHDVHIHIPDGAVPKDGPSAGITMATAIFSAITGKKVRADVAMTGEITLRGRVLPIGGLKEKLLAAKMAGVKTVCVPEKNQKDVEEISTEITKGLDIVLVSQMKEVLECALVDEES